MGRRPQGPWTPVPATLLGDENSSVVDCHENQLNAMLSTDTASAEVVPDVPPSSRGLGEVQVYTNASAYNRHRHGITVEIFGVIGFRYNFIRCVTFLIRYTRESSSLSGRACSYCPTRPCHAFTRIGDEQIRPLPQPTIRPVEIWLIRIGRHTHVKRLSVWILILGTSPSPLSRSPATVFSICSCAINDTKSDFY